MGWIDREQAYLCASVQKLSSLLEEFARDLSELLEYVLVIGDRIEWLSGVL